MVEYIKREDAINLLWLYADESCASVVSDFESLSAADISEVRHGRWIEDERTYPGPGLKNNLCSVCGEIAGSWKEGLEPGRKWAYCPNCGALMREVENGEK